MKIRELIKKLEEIEAKHGDMKVMIDIETGPPPGVEHDDNYSIDSEINNLLVVEQMSTVFIQGY